MVPELEAIVSKLLDQLIPEGCMAMGVFIYVNQQIIFYKYIATESGLGISVPCNR